MELFTLSVVNAFVEPGQVYFAGYFLLSKAVLLLASIHKPSSVIISIISFVSRRWMLLLDFSEEERCCDAKLSPVRISTVHPFIKLVD